MPIVNFSENCTEIGGVNNESVPYMYTKSKNRNNIDHVKLK